MSYIKHLKSLYKYVCGREYLKTGRKVWYVKMRGVGVGKYKTEKEAAKAADKTLIKKGKDPVNILKRKEDETTKD